MGEADNTQIRQGWDLFTRIFTKYDILGKAPMEIAAGEMLSAPLLHVIEAIGKGYGNTVTTLSNYFVVTKGGVSQLITKLHKLGYVAKVKRKGNDKEIVLELTKKGWRAFELHEKRNEPIVNNVRASLAGYSDDEIQSFLRILIDVERVLNESTSQPKA